MRFIILFIVAMFVSVACTAMGARAEAIPPLSLERRVAQLEVENAKLQALVQSLANRLQKLEAQVSPATAPTQGDGLPTREFAADFLTKHVAQPSIKKVEFIKGGDKHAEADGIIEPKVTFNGVYRFTTKVLKIVSGVLNANENFINGDYQGSFDAYFVLSTPLAERIDKITGIAAGPFPGTCSVQVVTAYQFPKGMEQLKPYIYTGRKATFHLQKYDDGWRVKGH